jgi:hypothetical protein
LLHQAGLQLADKRGQTTIDGLRWNLSAAGPFHYYSGWQLENPLGI